MSPPTLPHAPPMHWLDTAELSTDGRTATATRIIAPDHVFFKDGQLLPSALIEMMAQAAAAGSALLAQSQNRKVKQGVLVAMRDLRILRRVLARTQLTLIATRETSFGSLIKARTTASVDGNPVADATMTFHITFE